MSMFMVVNIIINFNFNLALFACAELDCDGAPAVDYT